MDSLTSEHAPAAASSTAMHAPQNAEKIALTAQTPKGTEGHTSYWASHQAQITFAGGVVSLIGGLMTIATPLWKYLWSRKEDRRKAWPAMREIIKLVAEKRDQVTATRKLLQDQQNIAFNNADQGTYNPNRWFFENLKLGSNPEKGFQWYIRYENLRELQQICFIDIRPLESEMQHIIDVYHSSGRKIYLELETAKESGMKANQSLNFAGGQPYPLHRDSLITYIEEIGKMQKHLDRLLKLLERATGIRRETIESMQLSTGR